MICIMQFLIGLSLCLFIHASWVSDTKRPSRAVHHLTLVYGAERVQTHFFTHDDLHEAVQRMQTSYDTELVDEGGVRSSIHRSLFTDDTGTDALAQLACVLYSSGAHAKDALVETFGESCVSTVHISESDFRACFLVSTTRQRLQRVMGSPRDADTAVFDDVSLSSDFNKLGKIDFVLWTSIPDPLKLHPSTLHHLDLLGGHPHRAQLLATSSLKNPSRPSDLSKTRIVLTVATSANGDEGSEGMEGIVAQLTEQLKRTSSPSALLEHLLAMGRGSSGPLLELAKAELETSDQDDERSLCSLSSLEVWAEGREVIVSGLHFLHAASACPSSCLAGLLALLARQKEVVDIRLRHDKATFNNYIKSIVQTEQYGEGEAMYPYHAAGLNGTGQVVGIGDSGLDERSCFFNEGDNSLMNRSNFSAPITDLTRRKVVQYVAFKGSDDTPGGHGTHVSGTVAGSVHTSPNSQQSSEDEHKMRLYGGHAPGAKVAFFDMSEDGNSIFYPSPLGEKVFGPARKAGARLHTNSWGGPFNFYDSDTISADKFQVEHDDFLALFAAGNDGSDGYFSVADPAVSKNSLTVGASMSNQTIERVAFFSSLGPTFDQRIKPDVVAPGYFTYSACAGVLDNVTCTVLKHAGTSMATPAVAGMAALIRQYFSGSNTSISGSSLPSSSGYEQVCRSSYPLCGVFSPRGATVKAMVIHSGVPMGEYYTGRYNATTTEPTAPLASPPDMYQGFGRVSLSTVLPYPGISEGLDLYVEELTVRSLQEVRYSVEVADNSRPLKVTVVWMDPVNHVISSRLLLHDLDLTVISPSGEVLYGNNQPGDEMNNVEQVSITTPLVNVTYTVRLQAKVFTESAFQNVSLVITSGGGVVSDKAESNSTALAATNALSCGEDEQMVVVRKTDRGGDGWGGGRVVVYRQDTVDSDWELNATMAAVASSDIIDYEYVCLVVGGVYNISLRSGGSAQEDEGQLQEMGVTVHQCGVYLSEYQPSALLSITSVDSCNPCRNNSASGGEGEEDDDFYSLQLVLVGSLYGIPYGWKGTTKYAVTSEEDGRGVLVSEGTLLVGMLEERLLCLPARSSYEVALEGIPTADDFLDDDYMAGRLGVEEYKIGVLGCNNTKYLGNHGGKQSGQEGEAVVVGEKESFVLAQAGSVIRIQIGTTGRCEMYVELPDSSGQEVLLPWYLEVVAAVLLSGVCAGMIIACLYCRGVRAADSPLIQVGEKGSSSEEQGKHSLEHRAVELYNYHEEDEEDESAEWSEANAQKKGIRAVAKQKLQKLRPGSTAQKHNYMQFASSSDNDNVQ